MEVGGLPLELRVLLLHQHEHEVPREHPGLLHPGLPPQRDLLPVLHPRLHVHVEDLPLRDHLLPLARFAAVPRGDHLARARALRAGHLHLLDHGPHLPDLDDHALPLAALAGGRAPRLGPRPRARPAGRLAVHRQLARAALVHLRQGAFELVHHVLPPALPRRAPAPALARHHLEQVGHPAPAPAVAHALLDRLLPVLVVDLALLRVLEHVVRLINLLELLRVPAFVRVVLHRGLAVGLLELGRARPRLAPQQRVVPRRVPAPPPPAHPPRPAPPARHPPHPRHLPEGEAPPEHCRP